MRGHSLSLVLFLLGVAVTAGPAHAADDPSDELILALLAAALAPPQQYSAPWGLRSLVPTNVARLDTTMGIYDYGKGNAGTTTVIMPLFGMRLGSSFMVLARLGVVGLDPPTGNAAASFINPVAAGMYSLKLGEALRLSFSLGASLPVGMGGDKTTAPGAYAANQSGMLTQLALDNSMFSVNDVGAIPGIDLAYVAHHVTVQAEATFFQLFRVRNAGADPDSLKSNFTAGLHAGVFAFSFLSLGAELRYQRYLSTPAAVAADESQRQTLALTAGPRLHVRMGDRAWFRPGVAYAVGFLGPTSSSQGYQVVQLDLPVVF